MLTADFFLFSTTSRDGRGFTDLLSQTFGKSARKETREFGTTQ
jgi:hypothetical protein